ncbi:hypothetical protein M0R45_006202 [Rubus argutus]|uniref:Uncharacterized protein n=1 Tax=Rubus argutus TaxID=59490 RepID=A0AAW1YPN4_RUBAR
MEARQRGEERENCLDRRQLERLAVRRLMVVWVCGDAARRCCELGSLRQKQWVTGLSMGWLELLRSMPSEARRGGEERARARCGLSRDGLEGGADGSRWIGYGDGDFGQRRDGKLPWVWGRRSEQRSPRVGQGFGNWISSEGSKGCEWLIMAVSLNGLVVELEGTGLFEMVSVIWLHGFMVVSRCSLDLNLK